MLNKDEILSLPVTQAMYDAISINRKSTFINIFDVDDEYIASVNTLDMKNGADFLFLAEVCRAGELNNLIPVNSVVCYKGIKFRLAAVQTSELQSNLKRNLAKREDFKKAPAVPQQQTAIQQNPQF